METLGKWEGRSKETTDPLLRSHRMRIERWNEKKSIFSTGSPLVRRFKGMFTTSDREHDTTISG
jgi:hypothetical protein